MAEFAWSRLLDDDERAVMQRYARARSLGLDGRRPALLVIDAVESFVGPNIPVAAAQDEAVTACGELAWQAIPNISALLDEWRRRQLPVAFSTVMRLSPNSRSSVERWRDGRLRSDVVVEPLKPQAGEAVFAKAQPSMFFGTPLMLWLRQQNADAVVLTGCTTSGCVRASAVDAFSYGIEVVIAEDACFDRIRSAHDHSLLDLSFKYAKVLPSSVLLQ